VTASPPKKAKRSVGRPRKNPLSAASLERTPDRDIRIFKFIAAYMLTHPASSEDEAIGAAEDKFRCSRSTIQRRIAPLKRLAPVLHAIAEILRQQNEKPAAAFDWTPYKDVTARLAVFYSPDDVDEIRTLGPRLALRIAQAHEELHALRATRKRARKKTAR